MTHRQVLTIHKPVVGMLHVPALPGSPRNTLPFKSIIQWVVDDADALVSNGIDAMILENFGDAPFFPGTVPVHTATFMTTLECAVKSLFDIPLGINVLRNDAITAMAVAAAFHADFIRVNIHTGARLTDQGVIQGKAHETLRYRKELDADIKIFADVDVKHSAALAHRPLADEVEETVSRGAADAVIVTGSATGKTTALEDLRIAKQAAGVCPVFVGSGVDVSNLQDVLSVADGVIVGTAFKRDRVTTNSVDPVRVRQFMESARTFRTA